MSTVIPHLFSKPYHAKLEELERNTKRPVKTTLQVQVKVIPQKLFLDNLVLHDRQCYYDKVQVGRLDLQHVEGPLYRGMHVLPNGNLFEVDVYYHTTFANVDTAGRRWGHVETVVLHKE